MWDFPNGVSVASRYTTESIKATKAYGSMYYDDFTMQIPSGVFSKILHASITVHSASGLWFTSLKPVQTQAIPYYIVSAGKQEPMDNIPVSFFLVGTSL